MPVASRPGEVRGVLVLAEDESRVRNHHWSVFINQHQKNRPCVKGRVDRKLTLLSHFLMGKPPAGNVIDHIDNDPLNNSMTNLRFATLAQNGQNRTITPNTSGYLGVTKHSRKWRARCNTTSLGSFDTPEEAARHYDSYVAKQYGHHAKRNFPNDQVQPYTAATKRQKMEPLPLGVSRTRQTERFSAHIGSVNLGTFDTSEEAACAYTDALLKKRADAAERLYSKPITRDSEGIPILPVKRAGQVVAHMKVDDNFWHDFVDCGLNLSPDGYPQSRKNNRTVLVHRFVANAPPGSIVDHINRIRTDNRRCNLRFVTSSENNRNRERYSK